tara:strand:+ start:253 stop:441 length:189 start_codon:yes stop_codon:yes gene_type:complete
MDLEEELPIELDCFMMTWGLYKTDRVAGYKPHSHAPYRHPKKNIQVVSVGWKPSHKGDQPPF